MEAQVLEISGNIVKVETELGCFCGTWCSSVPILHKKYVLELDCDEVVTIDNIELSNVQIPFIENIDGLLCLNGLVEAVQDNVMILRLQNSIIMLEISPEDLFHIFINNFVSIYLHTIYFYDIEIDG